MPTPSLAQVSSWRWRCRGNAPRTCWPRLRRPGLRAPAPARWPAGSGSTWPSSRCRRPVRCSRRWAAARCGRRRRCCPGPGSRPGKRCCPSASLRLTHQVKLSSSLWKMRSRNARSPLPRRFLLDLVDAPCGPGMHRRVDVAEGPFIGRQLPVGMHVPLAQHQQQLLLGEIRIDQRPAARSGTPGPRRHTTGTPTCRAWR